MGCEKLDGLVVDTGWRKRRTEEEVWRETSHHEQHRPGQAFAARTPQLNLDFDELATSGKHALSRNKRYRLEDIPRIEFANDRKVDHADALKTV